MKSFLSLLVAVNILRVYGIANPDYTPSVQLGEEGTCVLFENKELKCLGFSRTPTPFNTFLDLGPFKIRTFACGPQYHCIVFENNRVKCWGRNPQGNLVSNILQTAKARQQ